MRVAPLVATPACCRAAALCQKAKAAWAAFRRHRGPCLRLCRKMLGDPCGNRTHDYAVRGRRLSRLTKGPYWLSASKEPIIRKRAGTYLSSQVVSNQVFSARSSLTSVFGMGTGGTSTLSAPAIIAKALRNSLA